MNSEAENSKGSIKPKITVITGYYNRAHALEHTIESIMNQSFSNFEFIVFNDMSTDDTKERLAELEIKYNDPRLIILNHEQNKGFVQGMIDAVKLARGEYICVQGSGDFSYPERLKIQSEVLDNDSEIGAVGCFYENFVEDQDIVRSRKKVADDISFEQLCEQNVFSHGEVMFRKDIYNKVGGYRSQFINCQDYDLWLRMRKESKIATAKALLYRRYIRYDGVSYKPSKFLKQTRYFFLCQDIAARTSEEQVEILQTIERNGIESYMGLESMRVQKRIIKAVLRSCVWGETDAALELADKGITNPFVKFFLKAFVHIYKSPIGLPASYIVNKKLGIN